jgi:hypothetical protein
MKWKENENENEMKWNEMNGMEWNEIKWNEMKMKMKMKRKRKWNEMNWIELNLNWMNEWMNGWLDKWINVFAASAGAYKSCEAKTCCASVENVCSLFGPGSSCQKQVQDVKSCSRPAKVRLSGLVSWSTVLHCTVKATATVHQLTPDPKLKPQLSVIGAVSSSSRILSNRRQTTISVFFCR